MANPSAWRGAPHVHRSEVLDRRPGVFATWRQAAPALAVAAAGCVLVVGGLLWALG